MVIPHFLHFSFFEFRPWSKFWCCEIRRRCGPRTGIHILYARALGSLRARCRRCAIGRSFETDDEFKQHLAQRHKQQRDAARDRQRDRRKRSRPKREREQAERREAAAVETALTAAKAKRRRGGAAACGSGAVADSTQAARVARVHSLRARDVPCRYGLQ